MATPTPIPTTIFQITPTASPTQQTPVEINVVQLLWDYRNNSGFGLIVGIAVVFCVMVIINAFYEKFIKPINDNLDDFLSRNNEKAPSDIEIITPETMELAIAQIKLEYEMREHRIIREYDALIEQKEMRRDISELKRMIELLAKEN